MAAGALAARGGGSGIVARSSSFALIVHHKMSRKFNNIKWLRYSLSCLAVALFLHFSIRGTDATDSCADSRSQMRNRSDLEHSLGSFMHFGCLLGLRWVCVAIRSLTSSASSRRRSLGAMVAPMLRDKSCRAGGGAWARATHPFFLRRAHKDSLIFLEHLASFGIFRCRANPRMASFLRFADFALIFRFDTHLITHTSPFIISGSV